MSFIVQDWLLFVAPVALGFDEFVSAPFWLLYCAAAVLILYVLARAWGRIHGNRFLTVGLRRVLHRAHA